MRHISYFMSDGGLTNFDSGIVLEKVVEYFHYWYRYRDKEDVPDMDIPVELCLELLVAADYLGIDSTLSKVASYQYCWITWTGH
jgi:hypothetical protein